MKKIFNRRLSILLIVFAVVAILATMLIIYLRNTQSFTTSAASSYPYQVYFSDSETNKYGSMNNDIKSNIDVVYDAIRQRFNYLGSPQLNTIGVITGQEMDKYIKSEELGQDGYSVYGYYKRDVQKITLNGDIFASGDINSSHMTIGHEMLHSYVVKERMTNLASLVEEGIVEYLSQSHLYGSKDAYPQEVATTKEMLNTFKNLGYSDPDDLIQKIVFQEGIETGINNRLNKYLPAGQTQGAYAYLNSLYNAGKYTEARNWLKGVKAATAEKPADADPDKKTDPDKDPAKTPATSGVFSSILPSGDPETWTIDSISEKGGLLDNITSLVLLLAGGIASIYILVGAYYYFTAYGNEEQISNAKKTITWAIVGLVVIILSKVIVTEIWSFIAPASTVPTL